MLYSDLMRIEEITRRSGQLFKYLTAMDLVDATTRRESAIIKEETDKANPLPFVELSARGSLRVAAEYGKLMVKVLYTMPLRLSGIDGLMKLPQRYRKRKP